MSKYGMRYSAIRYWQSTGRDHVLHYGTNFGTLAFKGTSLEHLSARRIAHTAIAWLASCPRKDAPDVFRAMLRTGRR